MGYFPNSYRLASPPVIPKMYWDVYSQEERIKLICESIDSLASGYNSIVDEVNNIIEDSNERFDNLYQEMTQSLAKLRQELIDLISQLTMGQYQWDVQIGNYANTVDAQRDMFNDITIHSLTIKEFNELPLTVQSFAECGLTVQGVALLSQWLVKHFDIPSRYMIQGVI